MKKNAFMRALPHHPAAVPLAVAAFARLLLLPKQL